MDDFKGVFEKKICRFIWAECHIKLNYATYIHTHIHCDKATHRARLPSLKTNNDYFVIYFHFVWAWRTSKSILNDFVCIYYSIVKYDNTCAVKIQKLFTNMIHPINNPTTLKVVIQTFFVTYYCLRIPYLSILWIVSKMLLFLLRLSTMLFSVVSLASFCRV